MKQFILIVLATRDLLIRKVPFLATKRYSFAFLVHPRNLPDVFKKYPFAKYIPPKFLSFFLLHFWPVVISEITGLKYVKTGKSLTGVIISIPLTPSQMLQNRQLATKKILQGITLAGKMGASITGLGAFTSSITGGGRDIVDSAKTFITNGNSLTAATTVTEVEHIIRKTPKNVRTIAVVGATGSIGSAVSKILISRYGNLSFILVGKTPANVSRLEQEVRALNSPARVQTTTHIGEINRADLIVVATTADGAIIHSKHIKHRAVVYDITQPQNTPEGVRNERKDVCFIDGGLLKTPDIDYNFNFGIPREMAFSCLAETMILAAEKLRANYSIGMVSISKVKEMSHLAKIYNFFPVHNTHNI
ncbi:MAG: hypothetical protein AAB488_02670 [Patescibacteria group bacterium]